MKRLPWYVAVVSIAACFAVTQESTHGQQAGPSSASQTGVIAGRIVSPDASPVVGARVGALAASDNSAAAAVSSPAPRALMSLTETDQDGRYRLMNVPPGRYYIVFGEMDTLVYLPGVLTQNAATLLTLAAGQTLEGQDFNLKPPRILNVSGMITGEGRRLVGDLVLVRSAAAASCGLLPESAIWFVTKMAPDGSFAFPRVAEGTYQTCVDWVDNSRLRKAMGSVVVVAGDVKDLHIDVPLSAISVPVSGTLTVEGDGLVPRMRLRLVPLGTGSSPGPLDIELGGSFRSIPGGSYAVEALPPEGFALPPAYFVKSIVAGSTDLFKERLQLDGSGSSVRIAVTLGIKFTPWVKMAGEVSGMDTAVTRPSTITLISPLFQSTVTVPIEPDGSFSIPKMLPGTYEVRFTPEPDAFARTITVGAAETNQVTAPLAVLLMKVSGRVTGLPVPSANTIYEALLSPVGQSGLNAIRSARLGRSASHLAVPIESDGTFGFKTIPPGNYQLMVSSCQYFGAAPSITPGTGGAAGAACGTRNTKIVVAVTDKDIIGLDVPY